MTAGLCESGLVGAEELVVFATGRDNTSDSLRTFATGACGASVLFGLPSLLGSCLVGVGTLTLVALGSLVSFSFSWCNSFPCCLLTVLVAAAIFIAIANLLVFVRVNINFSS